MTAATPTTAAAFAADMDALIHRMEAGEPYTTDPELLALAEAALKAKPAASPEEWASRLVASMHQPEPAEAKATS